MGTILKIVGGLVLLFVVIAIAAGGSSKKAKPIPRDAATTARQTSSAAQSTAPTADPKGSSSLTCTYLLDAGTAGISSGQGGHFVGGGDLHNTGNIGIRLSVTATWRRLGSSPARLVKHYKVARGRSRTVNFRVVASIDDISAHQAADAKCSVHSRIVGTFGHAGDISP